MISCAERGEKAGELSTGSPICGVIAPYAGMHVRSRFGLRLCEAVYMKAVKQRCTTPDVHASCIREQQTQVPTYYRGPRVKLFPPRACSMGLCYQRREQLT